MFRSLIIGLQFAVSILLLLAYPAVAGSDSDTLRQFGLFGKWGDCSKGYWLYEDNAGGQPQYSVVFAGKQVGYRLTIQKVQLVSADTLSYETTRGSNDKGGTTTTVLLKKSGNTIHMNENKDSTHGAVIRDGKYVSTGALSDRMRKCG